MESSEGYPVRDFDLLHPLCLRVEIVFVVAENNSTQIKKAIMEIASPCIFRVKLTHVFSISLCDRSFLTMLFSKVQNSL